jgi:hypothetical protein
MQRQMRPERAAASNSRKSWTFNSFSIPCSQQVTGCATWRPRHEDVVGLYVRVHDAGCVQRINALLQAAAGL